MKSKISKETKGEKVNILTSYLYPWNQILKSLLICVLSNINETR